MRSARKRDAPNLFDAEPPAPFLRPNIEADLQRLLQAMFEQIGSAMKTREVGNEQNPD